MTDLFEGMYQQEGSLGAVEKSTLTLWLDKKYKEKFDILQSETNKEFGKRLQKLIMQAIDKVSGL